MLLRLGTVGSRPWHQGEVARQFGRTQQWLAQLEQRLRELARIVGPPDSLRRGLEQLRVGTVETAASAALMLYERALVREVLHPASLQVAAELFDMRCGFSVVTAKIGESLVVCEPHRDRLTAASSLARRLVQRESVVLVERLANDADLRLDVAAALVDHQPGLHRHVAWYWRGPDPPNTGLSRALHRALAGGPLPLPELHNAAKVALRYTDAALPQPDVLLAYLESQPAYRVGHGLIKLRQPSERLMTATDEALLSAFRFGHAEVSAGDLYAALHAAGLGRRGAGYLIATSPVVKRTRRGYYAALHAGSAKGNAAVTTSTAGSSV